MSLRDVKQKKEWIVTKGTYKLGVKAGFHA